MSPPPVLLRRYADHHAERLFQAARESVGEVHPWLPWCHPGYELDEAREWVALQQRQFDAGSEYAFAIESEAGDFLGGCGLNGLQPEHRCANLGYWVRSSAQRRGVASAAVRELAAWAFAETDLVRLEIVAALANLASRRVAERAGAQHEGVARARIHLHGVWHDAAVFSLVRAGVPVADA